MVKQTHAEFSLFSKTFFPTRLRGSGLENADHENTASYEDVLPLENYGNTWLILFPKSLLRIGVDMLVPEKRPKADYGLSGIAELSKELAPWLSEQLLCWT